MLSYNLAWGLAIHARFNDLDFQGPMYIRIIKCRFFLKILVQCSLNGAWLLHLLKRSSTVFCVMGTYLRDVTNTFPPVLHLSVSHLTFGSSCFTLDLEADFHE